ncbi:MAG: hypothetical protein CMO80_15480 [Verrucomicrobiales bacterium]|nr:hypothetical protein [Verrucomicrobiales bacterium]
MDGAHEFVERKIAASRGGRSKFWNADDASPEAYRRSLDPNRDRLKTIIGVVDERLPSRLEIFGDDLRAALVVRGEHYSVKQVRWNVLPGFSAEGLLVEPAGSAVANLILFPDADDSPEEVIGAGNPERYRGVRRLASNGFRILIPTPISRAKLDTNDRRLKRSDQTCREWIYRQAFHMGRHVIGYEVQSVMAGVDWFRSQHPNLRIGVAGHGEGGLVVFYAAAVDTRISSVTVSGYFGPRENVWQEPIYRNIWSLLREFDDALIAALIHPRSLHIAHGNHPIIRGHKGETTQPSTNEMLSEFQRISKRSKATITVSPSQESHHVLASLDELGMSLGRDHIRKGMVHPGIPLPESVRAARHERVFRGMETHVQSLVRASEHVRSEFFAVRVLPELRNWRWTTLKTHKLQNAETFIEGAREFRRKFHDEAMGSFDEPFFPANPRTRKIAETDQWTAYDVVLQVYPELIAWGALVLPKDLKPGEKRPVVVCQHGRNGVPLDTINRNLSAYNDFAARLAERGFITFAPHNLYRGEDRYRWLDRKANTIGATLFSFIIAQHDQILRWLGSLPFVDANRIAFYGLSYGGETAVRVPTILEGYCLSICSGDFNQWTRKIAATDQPFSFMRTIEWEMPYWNLGHTFDYAEMAYLMIPRPFMVERGHHDGVGRDHWVAHEYAKVRWLYAQLGMVDKTEIEFFQGGHSINGEGTFEFLHKHLNWPRR